mgnify:CR=1 FL=1
MNQRPVNQPHRRMTRAEVRRRRSRAIRRVAGLTAAVCLFVGGAAFLLNRHAPVPSASAASAPAEDAENGLLPAASSTVEETNGNALGLTADEAAAMLADPLMVLVNHTNKMPDDYTFETKECGSKTAVNKTLQTVACDAFLSMQKAAAAQGLNIYISSGYRSYSRQQTLYNNYVKSDGKALADTYSSRPGYSEHQTGLCFDLNTIDDSFGNTKESAWLEQHAQEYGFIIRFPKGKDAQTGYQYEPWHLRYLGIDMATKVYNSGLSLEEYLGITSEYAD